MIDELVVLSYGLVMLILRLILGLLWLVSYTRATRDPQIIIVTLGRNGTFLCSFRRKGTIIWNLTDRKGGNSIINTGRGPVETRGVFFTPTMQRDNMSFSEVTIMGTEANNGTKMQCAVDEPVTHFDESPTAVFRVYGPPNPVERLKLADQGNDLLLSWYPSVSSLLVTYLVEVWNESSMLQQVHINSTIFAYTPTRNACSILYFKVYAVNMAGNSNASVLTYKTLTKPRLQDVVSEVGLQSLNEEIVCDIKLNISSCPGFPVSHYFLILGDDLSNQSQVLLGPSMRADFSLNSSHLKKDWQYNYRVKAVNNINISSETERKQFLTTDVQRATMCMNSDSVVIICSFLSGSNSKGCYVRLIVSNDTKECYVVREDGLDSAEIKIMVPKLQEQEISVFDWEEDDSVGNLSIPISKSDTCLLTGTIPAKGNLSCGVLATCAIVGVVGTVLLVALITLMVGSFIKFFSKKQGHQQKNGMNTQENDPVHYESVYNQPGNSQSPNDGEGRYHQLGQIFNPPSTENESSHYSSIGEAREYAVLERNNVSSSPLYDIIPAETDSANTTTKMESHTVIQQKPLNNSSSATFV